MKKWPLTSFPGTLSLDGLQFFKVPALRPGALAEYEEQRGSKRVVVWFREGRLCYEPEARLPSWA